MAKTCMTKKKVKPVLVCDTRERKPWSFEKDPAFESIVFEKLDCGDYSIKGLEDIISIERKSGGDELLSNFLDDPGRVFAEFDRMDHHLIKVMIVEADLSDLLDVKHYYVNRRSFKTKNLKMPVAVVMRYLIDLMTEKGVIVLFAGKNGKKLAKQILLKVFDMHQKGMLDESE